MCSFSRRVKMDIQPPPPPPPKKKNSGELPEQRRAIDIKCKKWLIVSIPPSIMVLLLFILPGMLAFARQLLYYILWHKAGVSKFALKYTYDCNFVSCKWFINTVNTVEALLWWNKICIIINMNWWSIEDKFASCPVSSDNVNKFNCHGALLLIDLDGMYRHTRLEEDSLPKISFSMWQWKELQNHVIQMDIAYKVVAPRMLTWSNLCSHSLMWCISPVVTGFWLNC